MFDDKEVRAGNDPKVFPGSPKPAQNKAKGHSYGYLGHLTLTFLMLASRIKEATRSVPSIANNPSVHTHIHTYMHTHISLVSFFFLSFLFSAICMDWIGFSAFGDAKQRKFLGGGGGGGGGWGENRLEDRIIEQDLYNSRRRR